MPRPAHQRQSRNLDGNSLLKFKNLEAEKMPPTLRALKPHIQRGHLVSVIGKGYNDPQPQVPLLTENGSERLPDGSFFPKKCLEIPAPQAVV